MDTTAHPLHPSTLRPGDIVTVKANDPENDPENLWSQTGVIDRVNKLSDEEDAYVLHFSADTASDAVCIGYPGGNLYIADVQR